MEILKKLGFKFKVGNEIQIFFCVFLVYIFRGFGYLVFVILLIFLDSLRKIFIYFLDKSLDN